MGVKRARETRDNEGTKLLAMHRGFNALSEKKNRKRREENSGTNYHYIIVRISVIFSSTKETSVVQSALRVIADFSKHFSDRGGNRGGGRGCERKIK